MASQLNSNTAVPAVVNPTQPQNFLFDTHNVRVVMREDEIWFVAKDVCDVLEHSNSRMALDRLDTDEKGVSIVYTLGGEQELAIINESGLYSLVLTSRKPEAKRFKKWITSEVIPTLRKTGRYELPQIPPQFDIPKTYQGALRLAADLQDKLEKTEIERDAAIVTIQTAKTMLENQQPKVMGFDRLIGAEGDMSISVAAKTFKMSPKYFSQWLRDLGWTFYRKNSTHIEAYKHIIDKNFLKHSIEYVDYVDETTQEKKTRAFSQVKVTPEGLRMLAVMRGTSMEHINFNMLN